MAVPTTGRGRATHAAGQPTARTTTAKAIAATSATAASTKYHQCGCRSRTIVSLSFSSLRGYGTDATVLCRARMVGGCTPARPALSGDDGLTSPDQLAAVTTPSTLVAVIAGAGSGKTRVLTRRIAHRIAIGTADARHTLALTFTREAAGELRRRLRRAGVRDHVEAGTFHSVALGLLRQRWLDLDRRPP